MASVPAPRPGTLYDARHGVRHAWLVDVIARRLEAYELEGDAWREIGTFDGSMPVRVAPFDEAEVGPLWE